MNRMIRPRLMNGSFGDPFIYCPLIHVGRAFTFDMGASFELANRELQRIDAVYISHTHMDHIFGFEHFLRANLKQRKTIHIFGPKDIHLNIQGKLKGFTWNLVHGYGLVFEVTELTETTQTHYRMFSREQFKLHKVGESKIDKPVEEIHRTDFYQTTSTQLDHRVPSRAYAITENIAVSINKDALEQAGWKAGSWLEELKHLAIKDKTTGTTIDVPLQNGEQQTIAADELRAKLIIPRKRQKIAYVTDTIYSKKNEERIVELAKDADLFFCESAFMSTDSDKAKKTFHLTAQQTGRLAKLAGCERLCIFHLAKKYLVDPRPLIDEASEAFGKEVEVHLAYRGRYDYRPESTTETSEAL